MADSPVLPQFFVPQETVRIRSSRDHRPYAQWVAEGYLEATAGNVVDYEAVRAKLNEWDVTYDVRAVGFDPWNATDLVNRLKEQDGLHCVPVRQGFASLSAPTKELTKAIIAKTLTA